MLFTQFLKCFRWYHCKYPCMFILVITLLRILGRLCGLRSWQLVQCFRWVFTVERYYYRFVHSSFWDFVLTHKYYLNRNVYLIFFVDDAVTHDWSIGQMLTWSINIRWRIGIQKWTFLDHRFWHYGKFIYVLDNKWLTVYSFKIINDRRDTCILAGINKQCLNLRQFLIYILYFSTRLALFMLGFVAMQMNKWF